MLFAIFGSKQNISSFIMDVYYKLLTIPNFLSYLNNDFIKFNSMVLEKFAFNKNDIVDEFERIENLTEVKNISKALDFSMSIKKYLEETLVDSQLDVLSLVNLDYDKKEKLLNIHKKMKFIRVIRKNWKKLN